MGRGAWTRRIEALLLKPVIQDYQLTVTSFAAHAYYSHLSEPILCKPDISANALVGHWAGTALRADVRGRSFHLWSVVPICEVPTATGPKPEVFNNLKPVRIPEWVWDAKDGWAEQRPESRRRLTEHFLRVALVTAALNGDREINKQRFEAALRFMEWQERIREIYRPGLAETKEAEACESVDAAPWERFNKQISEGVAPKGR